MSPERISGDSTIPRVSAELKSPISEFWRVAPSCDIRAHA
jgi:hypothetical protein